MSFVPHGSVVHTHAPSSRGGDAAMDAEPKRASAKGSGSDEAGFWLDPQSNMAECALCHHRAFSPVAAYLDFWTTVHARYCAKRANQELGRAS